MAIDVIKPGLCTTVQDAGRVGHQRAGVPVNGPMDPLAHAVANLLAGNPTGTGALEITLTGPTLRFDAACLIALGGADLGATLDGRPFPPGHARRLSPGSVLTFGRRVNGARAYLAVHGGFPLEPVLGSTSAYLRGAYPGLTGRMLVAGDRLPIASRFRNPPRLQFPQALQRASEPRPAAPIRVISGREWDAFSDEAQHSLVNGTYRIGNDAERMGYRLEGEPLELREPLELLSEAVTFGTVQVPPSGQPIVLMADRQTTGGYPKIAHVISVDLPLLAQRLPGDDVRFERIGLAEAQALAVERARLLARLESEHA